MQRVFLRRHSTALTLEANVRRLLRHVAHPVAVITAPTFNSSNSPHPFHGATVSSLTSIAMHPTPLLAFALRLPSRLADALKHPPSTQGQKADLVVNYLEENQTNLSRIFARGDLSREPLDDVSYTLNGDGIPVLKDCLCAMSCKIVTGIPLRDIGFLERLGLDGDEKAGTREESGAEEGTNELFIVRIVGVEKAPESDGGKKPLLYHNTRYTRLAS